MAGHKYSALTGRVLLTLFKGLLWIVGIVMGLLLLAMVVLYVPATRRALADKASSMLADKLGTEVQVGDLKIGFPRTLQLNNVFCADSQKDTLVFVSELGVDLDLAALLKSTIRVSRFELHGTVANIVRHIPDTTFNYQFIVSAFAGDTTATTTQADTTASKWQFDIGDVLLNNIRLAYIDESGGMKVHALLGKAEGRLNAFDLDNYEILAKELAVSNTSVRVRKSESILPEDTSTTETAPWRFGSELITLHNVTALYSDGTDSSSYDTGVRDLEMKEGEILLGSSTIQAKSIEADGAFAKLFLGSGGEHPGDSVATETEEPLEWKISLASLTLGNSEVELVQQGAAPQTKGFDPSHMALSGLMIQASSLAMNGEDMRARIIDLRFTEHKGFTLGHFSGDLHYQPQGVSATNFSLVTASSRLGSSVELTYNSLEELSRAPQRAHVKASLGDCVIGMRDVYYFLPSMSNSLSLSSAEKIFVDADIEGSMESLAASALIRWRGSRLNMDADVRDLHITEQLYVSLDSMSLITGRDDIMSLLPTGTLPENISLPAEMTLESSFEGYLRNFNAAVNLRSTMGSMRAIVKMDPAQGNTVVPYSGEIHTGHLALGEILQQKDVGPLTFSVAFDGSGLDTSSFDTQLELHLVSFVYKKYDYKDLTLEGRLVKSSFRGTSTMRDDNLAFDFSGMVNLDKTAPAFSFELELKGADFRKLNFTEDDTRLSGVVRADLALPSGKNPQGTAGLYNVVIRREGLRHQLDSLVFKSFHENGEDRILLASEKLEGEARGTFLLPELGTSVMNYVNSHFDLDPAKADSIVGENQIIVRLRLKDPAFLTTGLVPGLKRLLPMELSGEFNSKGPKLSMDMYMPGALYADTRIDSIKVSVRGDADGIKSAMTLSQFSDTTNYKFENVSLQSLARNDSLAFGMQMSKDDSTHVLDVDGVVLGGDSAYTLRLSRELTLGTRSWVIDSANTIRFGPQPLHIARFVLSDGSQKVAMGHTGGAGSPLKTVFTNFEIASLTSVMQHSVPLVSGVVNGSFVIEQQDQKSAFRSNLKITSLNYKNVPIGDIVLKADNFADPGAYDITLLISGQGNDIELGGTYHINRKNDNLDIALRMRSLRLAALEPFTGGEVTRMDGWLAGDLTVKGEPASPVIAGAVNIHEVAFRPKFIDTYLRMPGGELQFKDHKVMLSKLTVLDSLGNKASMSGNVNIRNMTEPVFDLKLHTDNFLAMNTDRHDNELYFGKIFLDSDVHVTGTPAKPTVEVKAKLNKGSAITYIKPEDQILKDESRGIVEFTDSLGEYARIMVRRDSAAVRGITGLQLNAAITIDRDFDLKVIVDPIAGDSLFIRGGGRLHFTMERNGSTALSGKYNITKGGYFLTISDFVKRDFSIEPGSSVTWSGDPLDAYLDLNAVYRVKASPFDLMQQQVAGVTDVEANKYRNLLKFDVILKMVGFISSPQISFDIGLAPEDRGAHGGMVGTRLAQLKEDENQLNKQVFALLTLRRFVGENPLEGGGGGGLSSAGRSSASKVLTQQLSTLSDRYVNFVDLDLGVNSYEDYSTGSQQGRTQVQVGVSKQLFNDRVTVSVGGNVDVEGPQAAQNDMNDVAGNLGIEYKLTEDGRYRLKAFRENQYENPIEGEITRTGAGFVFSRDFNKFKNLFRKPRAQRQKDAEKK